MLAPRGPVAFHERTILFDALAIMLVIVAPLIVAIGVFAWWFRSSNPRAKRLPTWAFSGGVEIMVWAAPLLTIMFLGGLTWISTHELDPYKPLPSRTKPLEVQVVSLDWKWLFIYPDQGVASVNGLAAPAGAPVHFTLTSGSVMNAFFVPQLGSMIYTMNGMATQVSLQADKPGAFEGLSAMFSGDGFPGMRFTMTATSQADFDRWVQAARTTGGALDPAAYKALAQQSSDVKPFTYGTVSPGLFDAVVRQEIPPSAGPKAGRASPEVSPRTTASIPSARER